jgi:hypothetical protein
MIKLLGQIAEYLEVDAKIPNSNDEAPMHVVRSFKTVKERIPEVKEEHSKFVKNAFMYHIISGLDEKYQNVLIQPNASKGSSTTKYDKFVTNMLNAAHLVSCIDDFNSRAKCLQESYNKGNISHSFSNVSNSMNSVTNNGIHIEKVHELLDEIVNTLSPVDVANIAIANITSPLLDKISINIDTRFEFVKHCSYTKLYTKLPFLIQKHFFDGRFFKTPEIDTEGIFFEIISKLYRL